jgi:hypothetical protein
MSNDDTDDPVFEKYVNQHTPRKVIWFAKHGYKVIEISAADQFCIFRVKDASGNHLMFAILNPDYEY